MARGKKKRFNAEWEIHIHTHTDDGSHTDIVELSEEEVDRVMGLVANRVREYQTTFADKIKPETLAEWIDLYSRLNI